jgi:hypothetical protein
MTSPGRRGRETVLAYSGGVIDRAASQRSDPGWVDATLARASTRVIPMWRDQCVVSGEPAVPVILPAAEAGAVLNAAAELAEHAAAAGRLGREDSIDSYLLRSWLEEVS